MNDHRVTLYRVGSLLLLALLLAACVPPGTQATRPATVRLKVAVQPFLSFSPLYIAQDEGFFAEQGLQVEFAQLKPSEAAAALAQGQVDVMATNVQVSILNAIAHGAHIRHVADKGYYNPAGCAADGLVAGRALLEGIPASPEKVKGRVISREDFSHEEYFVDKLLSAAGLTPADVSILNLPSATEIDALDKGTIDLTMTSEPLITREADAGVGRLWLPASELLPYFQIGVLAYGPTLIRDNRDAGNRFMVAYLKGVRQFMQGKTDRNLEIISRATGLDRELIQRMCWSTLRDDGSLNKASLLDFQAWAFQKGYLDSKAAESDLYDPSFVEYAGKALAASR